MAKEALLEWTIAEDEQVWQALADTPVPGQQPYRHLLSSPAGHAERQFAALLLLLGMVMAGVWLWQRHNTQADVVRQLHVTVAQDTHAQQNDEASGSISGLFAIAPGPFAQAGHPTPGAAQPSPSFSPPGLSLPQVQLHRYEVMGDRVMARATVLRATATGDARPYRETYFYRHTDGQWQRIEPDPDLLGPKQTLHTAHFVLRYRAVDAAAVRQIAQHLDGMYGRIRRDVGLPAISPLAPIVIEISGAEPVNTFTFLERGLVVASPALLSVPVEVTASEVLSQALVYRLAVLTVNEIIDQNTSADLAAGESRLVHWWPLFNALPLWVVWHEDGVLANGRDDVLRWLVHNAQAGVPTERQAIPNGYARLCRMYALWKLAPVEMSIPLSCTETDLARQRPIAPMLPLRLDTLVAAGRVPDSAHLNEISAVQIVGLETVIEYMVATYGRDHVARFVAATFTHADWQSLIPAVFDVSATEFEVGWQHYVETRYGDDGLAKQMHPVDLFMD